MIAKGIRAGQYWTDGGHRFEVVECGVHDIEVRYDDGSRAYYMEDDFEDFTPL